MGVLIITAALCVPTILQLWLYDSRPAGVACDDLPSHDEVAAALDAHADVVRAIEDVGDQVDVVLVEPCRSDPTRAEIVVFYPGGDDREDIEAILDRADLGVPVSLRNA